MIPIKIECECGQRYAFDAEPVNGQMPFSVACPVCGADGTIAANQILVQQSTVQPAAVAESKPASLRVAPASNPVHLAASTAPALTTARRTAQFGQVDHTQVIHEAKAKAMWGDSKEEVIKYLMMQGFSYEEASNVTQTALQERAAAVRTNGIRKIFSGVAMTGVPVGVFAIFGPVVFVFLKLFAITIMIGLWGAWLTINGILMAVAPKSEKGDVANQ
jgi:hypothetical protein